MEQTSSISQPQVGKRECVLFVTGFGKFQKVSENPTTHLSRAIPSLLEQNQIENLTLNSTQVVTVSIEDCNEALKQIYEEINKMQLKDQFRDHCDRRHYIVIHFGVYQGSGKFNVEVQGKNIKDFRIPDENGNTPLNECINGSLDIKHCIQTTINVDSIVEKLQQQGHNVQKSFSAGEYICNYTYYCSLQNKNEKVVDSSLVDTLFCHVPTFAEIDEPSQQRFVVDLIAEVCKDCQSRSCIEKIE
eukprot:403357607